MRLLGPVNKKLHTHTQILVMRLILLMFMFGIPLALCDASSMHRSPADLPPDLPPDLPEPLACEGSDEIPLDDAHVLLQLSTSLEMGHSRTSNAKNNHSQIQLLKDTLTTQAHAHTSIAKEHVGNLQLQHENQGLHTSRSKSTCAELDSIPIFVLNLDRRKDRLDKLTQFMLQSASWMLPTACRISAPDATAEDFVKRLDPKLIHRDTWEKAVIRDEKHLETIGGPLTKGAVGCYLGHALMWEQTVNQSSPWALVMEDDIIEVHSDLSKLLCEVARGKGRAAALPADWDVLQIQTPNQHAWTATLSVSPGSDYNTGMYLITRTAAQKALRGSLPMVYQLDSPHAALRTLTNHFYVKPSGATQSSILDTDVQITQLLEKSSNASVPLKDCKPVERENMMVPELAHFSSIDRAVK